MRKIIKIGIIVILVCLVAFSIWYHLPIHRTASMTLCTLEGETAEIEIDISFYRHFFKPDTMKGTVIWDGEEYVAAESAVARYEQKGDDFLLDMIADFGERVQAKLQGDGPSMTFLKDGDPIAVNRVFVLEMSGKYSLDQLDIMAIVGEPDENGNMSGAEYFGPAATPEEAEALYREFYAEYLE